MTDKNTYVTQFPSFVKKIAGGGPSWLLKLRRAAIDRFAELGFPTHRDESWRFTQVRPIAQARFEFVEKYKPDAVPAARLGELAFDDSGFRRLVFVNGHYAEDLSSPGKLPRGAILGGMRSLLESQPDLIRRHLGMQATYRDHAFVALNLAYMIDGAVVYLPKGMDLPEPIHLLFLSISDGAPTISHPRNLIVAEEGSRATILESYVGPRGGVYLTNAVTEIVVGANADIDHYKLQRESVSAYHVGVSQAQMSRDSRFNTDSLSLGGALVRNDLNAVLDGEGIECTLDGLYVGDHRQHVDHHTFIRHVKPHCASHELFKGILNGHARGVFNGKIYVNPGAIKTDSKQTNRCMLLSDDAQINTNPQLEIYADDVKCTHGASIGQLDETAVFYLRARGIPKAQARQMLVFAFANEVLERIRVDALRERLAADLFSWLSGTAA